MLSTLRKILLTSLVLISFQCNMLHAGSPYPFECFRPVCPPLACAPGYNPPAYLSCPCEATDRFQGISLRADLLWWRACEEGITLGAEESFSSKIIHTNPTYFLLTNNSKLKNLHNHYKPGFRLGIDSFCLCQGGDVALNWTHFHSAASARGNSCKADFFLCWDRILNVVPEAIKGRWKLQIDLLDLEFGRKFYVSSCFVLRPHLGLRAARITQSYRINSFANDPERNIGFSDTFDTHVKATENFMAIGPRLGALVEYRFGCGWALFGEAAASILYGRFNRHAKQHSAFLPDGESQRTDYHYKTSTGCDKNSRTISDLAVGLSYSRCFDWCGKLRRCTFAFAWEHHVFYGQNAFNFAPNAIELPGPESRLSRGKTGDLHTQGLTLSADVGF